MENGRSSFDAPLDALHWMLSIGCSPIEAISRYTGNSLSLSLFLESRFQMESLMSMAYSNGLFMAVASLVTVFNKSLVLLCGSKFSTFDCICMNFGIQKLFEVFERSCRESV